MKKISLTDIKKGNKSVMITAYDALFTNLFDEYVDILLVGDSLNMIFGGCEDTLSITLEEMIYHTKAVCRARKKALVVTDMPFGTYNNKQEALSNANKIYKQTLADAIKLEGGESRCEIIKYLTDNSIAVMAHIGLMPQFCRSEGGYKVKGKNTEDINQLIKDAKAVENAGAFCVVLEGISTKAVKEIVKNINIPTIGIGAGNETDGQVLVSADMLGLFEGFKPKFVKKYLDGSCDIRKAVKTYAKEVQEVKFPTKEYSYE